MNKKNELDFIKFLNPRLCSLKQTYQLKYQQIKILAHLSKLKKRKKVEKNAQKSVFKKTIKVR